MFKISNLASIAADIANNAGDTEALADQKTGLYDAYLAEFQKAEREHGMSPQLTWMALCYHNGWAHKVYDATHNKMANVDGAKAPNKVKVPVSYMTSLFADDADAFRTAPNMKSVRDALKAAPATLVEKALSAIDKVHKAGDTAGLNSILDHLTNLKAAVPAGSSVKAAALIERKAA